MLVVVEEGASAEVREIWDAAPDAGAGILYPVAELVVGQNANLRYLSVQELDEKTWILGSQRASVARDGNLDWAVLGLGGGGGRIHLDATLDGEGAEARVTGAYATRARQHLDYATKQIHAAPRTNSDLAFRGILNGRSTAVWSGMIEVVPGAQKIDAFQESRNLLVSKKAHADAIPGLEILANDVRCTHARRHRTARRIAALLPPQPRTPRARRQAPHDRRLPPSHRSALRRGHLPRPRRERSRPPPRCGPRLSGSRLHLPSAWSRPGLAA